MVTWFVWLLTSCLSSIPMLGKTSLVTGSVAKVKRKGSRVLEYPASQCHLTSGRTRPIDITPRQFVHEWSDRVKTVTRAFREIRGKDKDLQFLGPSFAWDDYVRGTLEPNAVFENGYGAVNRIGEIAMHK
ncbi:hypothetical protein NW767_014767 [Fusarium falciforme]|nr:hypothetical protein NW767_014767 [Fusarium falciforme]